ncbi:MAG: glycosyltransferase family 4 protein [Bacteroidota bacterium]
MALTVGILANEFFSPAHTGLGGFGWAATRALDALRATGDHEVVLLAGAGLRLDDDVETLHGARVLRLRRPGMAWTSHAANAAAHLTSGVDVVLSIDYRPTYLPWFLALPRTPVIVWVRDPRTPDDWDRVRSLRLPGGGDAVAGVDEIETRSLGRFVRKTRALRRPVLLAGKMAYLQELVPATYGLPASEHVLCNPDVVDYAVTHVAKSDTPRVLFLGRLDPIKRPWLFVALARQFPEVEFLMLGRRHFEGAGGWQPTDVPANVRFLGHVDGQEKLDLLSSAWALVNTSVYEEAPVSVFEALAYETPVVATIDSDRIVERHGVFTGRFDGDGLGALPALAAGLARLLEDAGLRRRLGAEGRAFVEAHHATPQFLRQFADLCRVTRV